jgi:hypothetical protein
LSPIGKGLETGDIELLQTHGVFSISYRLSRRHSRVGELMAERPVGDGRKQKAARQPHLHAATERLGALESD